MPLTQVSPGLLDSQANAQGFRNRIINGDMRISQAQAGASVTQGTQNLFPVDRFLVAGSVASKFTAQQSAVAPAGFKNSVLITSSSAYSVGSAEAFVFQQRIEGFNVADLGWGTADAQTVTLSFRVRSSLTGTFGGSLRNSAADRSYPFSYTISAANTWETKTITIAGDTAGTWLSDNGIGINLTFSMGTGSTLSGTAGAWAGSNLLSATGATSVVGTNGATFYITGVQLEKGTAATDFERLDYGRQLIQCQRYYQKSYPQTSVPGASYDSSYGGPAYAIGTGNFGLGCGRPFAVVMRAAPTMVTYDSTGTSGRIIPWNLASVTYSTINATDQGITGLDLGANSTLGRTYTFGFTASAEL